jgi:hypothetical protein
MVLLVVFIEAFLHYFRWRLVLGGRELPRVAAYTVGVLGLMLPYSAWLMAQGMVRSLDALTALWMVIVFGGLAVLTCYGLDAVVDLVWFRKESMQRDALRDGDHGKG